MVAGGKLYVETVSSPLVRVLKVWAGLQELLALAVVAFALLDDDDPHPVTARVSTPRTTAAQAILRDPGTRTLRAARRVRRGWGICLDPPISCGPAEPESEGRVA
jgi:hypothetical protein